MKVYSTDGEVYDKVEWVEMHDDTKCAIFADDKYVYKLELNEFDKVEE